MKKGDFYVLDQEFKTLMHIDVYYSMIWTDRYNEAGDFELCISPSEEVCKCCVVDNYIWYNNSETLMFIEKVEYKSTFEDGPQLIVSGRDLKSILGRRILFMTEKFNNWHLQDVVENLLNRNIIEPLTLWHSEDGWSDQPRTVTYTDGHYLSVYSDLAWKRNTRETTNDEGDIAHASATLGSGDIAPLGNWYHDGPAIISEEDGHYTYMFEYLDLRSAGGVYISPDYAKELEENFQGFDSLPDIYKPLYVKEVTNSPDDPSTDTIITRVKQDENKNYVEDTHTAICQAYRNYVVEDKTTVIYQTKDYHRTIENFKFKKSTDPRITEIVINEELSFGTSLLDAIATLCKANGCGFKVTMEKGDEDFNENFFVFELYMGEDRSFNQMANPWVVFSNKNGNLISMDSKIDRGSNYANFAYFTASDYKDEVSTGEKGLYRREMQASVNIEDEELPEPEEGEPEPTHTQEWMDRAKQIATDELIERANSIEGEIKIEPELTFEFGKDYYVGDIVQTETDWGFNYRLRVTEFVTNYSPEGLLMYPTVTEIVDIADEEERQ